MSKTSRELSDLSARRWQAVAGLRAAGDHTGADRLADAIRAEGYGAQYRAAIAREAEAARAARLYIVQATINGSQRPTFYLDGNALGIVSLDHARRIAADILGLDSGAAFNGTAATDSIHVAVAEDGPTVIGAERCPSGSPLDVTVRGHHCDTRHE